MSEQLTKPELDQVLLHLTGSKDMVHAWWNSENKAFDDMMPKDVYYQNLNGRQEISDYIAAWVSGDFA